MTRHSFPQSNEGADDLDAHPDRAAALQHVREHQATVLSERERQNRRELQSLEVIAFCDHLALLRPGQAEHEIEREPIAIPPYLLVESARRYAVKSSNISIKHHSMPS